MPHPVHATRHGPVPVCSAVERQTETMEMQFNNFSLDTYCALVLLETLREKHFPEFTSDKPIPERVSLLKKAWNALRRRFSRKHAVAPVFENVARLAEYQSKPQPTLSASSELTADTHQKKERKAV